MNKKISAIKHLGKVFLVNTIIFFVLLCVIELALRIIRQDGYSVNRLRLSFSYYEMFTASPVRSQYVNIIPVGNVTTKRLTPTNPAIGLHVFMFGGSTTIGLNDPTNPETADETTIASHLATRMKNAGYPVIVENFGVGSFRSSEELAKLIKLLRAGYRPDYVIFYDGYNDAEFAARSQVVHDFMLPTSDIMTPYVSMDYCEKALRQFELYNVFDRFPLLQGIIRRISFIFFYRKPAEEYRLYDHQIRIDGEISKDVSASIAYCASNYLENTRMIRAIGKEYGFRSLFVLQPMIYFKKNLLGKEKEVFKKIPETLRERTPVMFDRITDAMSSYSDFFCITDVFDNTEKEIFTIDQGHILSEGNRIVADRLASILIETIKKDKFH